MHISSIVLHGFKSFGKKSTIKLGRGITAVVGPNGCGKTNIVDAIRWVLGEQRQSVIRAGRMEEIIFNGSQQHKPSSICEVSLTIHNDKGKLPSEYSDVEITRRLYRDGESEYLINRQPCRLKDITDLFMDTGMGSDAYSVIELKMVEGILSEFGDDRRRMFEEAAGVNKYKKQRTSTFKKLEATRLDLERISDITSEVSSKVRGLELQLKRYDRHHKLTSSLEEKDLALARLMVHDLEAKKHPLEADLKIALTSRDSEAGEISIKEKEIATRREALAAIDDAYQAARQKFTEGNEKLNEHHRQVLVWNEQIKSLTASIERLGQESQREEANIAERQADTQIVTANLEKLAPETDERRKAYEKLKSEEVAFTDMFKSAEKALEEAREKKYHHRQQLAEATSSRKRTAEFIERQKKIIDGLEEDIRNAEVEQRDRQAARDTLEKKISIQAASHASLIRNAERGAIDAEGQLKLVNQLKDAQHEAETSLKLLETQLAMLQTLTDGMDGYAQGAREILDEMASHPGILGTVADLAKVSPEHAEAVEIALGPAATALVAKTSSDAKLLLESGKSLGLGKFSVIPLDAVRGAVAPETLPASVRPLLDFVSVPDQLMPLFEALLGHYCLEAQGSTDIPSDLPSGVSLITGSGDQHGKVPIWTHSGGTKSGASASTAIVGRSQELQRLGRETEQAEMQLAKARDLHAAAQAKGAELREANSERTKLIESAAVDIASLKDELHQISYQAEQSSSSRAEADKKLPQLNGELADHEKLLKSYSDIVTGLQKSAADLHESTDLVAQKHAEAQTNLSRWREQLQEQRVALINLENDREKLAERKLILADMITNSKQRLATYAKERVSHQSGSADLANKVDQAAKEEAVLTDELLVLRKSADVEEAKVREGREAISTSEVELRAIAHRREAALGDLQNKRLELEQYKQSEALVRSRIKELYGRSVGKYQESDEALDGSTLQGEVDSIRRSIERIGPVNMAVADEHGEEQERLDFLLAQQVDLTTATETLRETIEKIDQTAREQFQETYDKIRHHFKQTFNMFFEGGKGDLRLVGDPDPLDSDIEIIAILPGKSSRSLRSLSAGEKALTAIALLFAIYMVKPSPYCILDEVDAPLDDINIGKFSKVISQFANETQFIVVTHNKLSMSQADYLYGVTMAEEGLSTLVSVDMHDAAA